MRLCSLVSVLNKVVTPAAVNAARGPGYGAKAPKCFEMKEVPYSSSCMFCYMDYYRHLVFTFVFGFF